VVGGLIALVVVFAAASIAGLGIRRRSGRFRGLNVFTTPTVFVLAADGSIAQRASGLPRKAEVLATVSSVLAGGTP
jgi:hypothetical protein